MAKIQKKIETTIPFNSIFLFSTQRLSIRGATIPTRLCRLPEQELQQPSSTRTNITILPQNTQNPQNLLADKSLPQIAQINTD
mgnify:CR=1 FL=1